MRFRENSRLYFYHIKRLVKCKRSQAHVEMILSMIIFIGFLVAMLIILNPLKINKQVDYTLLDITSDQILKNLSSNYTTLSLVVNNGPQNCFLVKDILNYGNNLVVKDLEGTITQSKKQGDDILIKPVGTNRFYMIYFSDKLEPKEDNLESCEELASTDYLYGSLNTEDIVFYENIEIFNQTYYENYIGLKEILELETDFEFYVYNSLKEEIFKGERFTRKDREVISRDIPIRIINKDAEFSNVIINIRVLGS